MKELEKYVSPFTEQMFPAFYREEGEMFITFVKAYFEWLESSDQVLYNARRLPEYRDIDKTLDDFIIYFKEKYLKNIQFTTASNKRLFVKNALDFYRAKGTERAVDLFFKLIHGMEARVYYPGDDLFKVSDNEWVDVQYLEVTREAVNVNLVGKVIYGTVSGASGFVERLVRRRTGTTYVDIFYVSNVEGDFQTGETIRCNLSCKNYPTIIGSLTSLTVTSGGAGFEVGESVIISGGTIGTGAKATVTEVESVTGIVSFSLEDGGFGYNTNSEVLISDYVLTGNTVSLTNTEHTLHNTPFKYFETVTERLANVSFDSSTSSFTVGETVTVYDVGGNTTFEGKILSLAQPNGSNTGSMVINYDETSSAISNGELIYTTGNTISANVTLYTDVTATGNVMASGNTGKISYTQNTATINVKKGQTIYQKNSFEYANAVVSNAYSNAISGESFLEFKDMKGCIRSDDVFYVRSTGKSYNIVELRDIKVGVINVSNQFVTGGNVYSSDSGTHMTLNLIGSGTSASFSIISTENDYAYEYNTDLIQPYANVALDANAYGFPGNTSANLTNGTIGDALTYANDTVGSISEIGLFNVGENYGEDPLVTLYESTVMPFRKFDYVLKYTSETGNFLVGEKLTSNTSGATGIVTSISASTKTMNVTRLTLFEDFVIGELITGSSSGSSAELSYVNVRELDRVSGINALVTADASTTDGGVLSLNVVSSGFGYIDNDEVLFTSLNDSSKTGFALTSVEKQGIGEGFYRNRKGFLSSDKYIHDGDFYQEYSYEVLTSLPFENYKNTLKKVLHVAGTKPFGSYVSTIESNSNITITSSTVTTS